MDKYISLQAVLDIASQYCPDDDGSCSKVDVDLREMLDEIEAMPATKGKHGKFVPFTDIERYETFKDGGIPYDGRCSVCNSCLFNTDKYCADCGARMDGEKYA